MLSSASSQPAQARALDYGQSTARLTRPRRTGLTVDVLDVMHFLAYRLACLHFASDAADSADRLPAKSP
jgi:hypothetical protein